MNALDRSGRTMLFYALRNKNQIAVDWLLEHKATPVPRDFNFAMYRNDLVVLQTMLDINTDLNVPDQGGRTPLTYLVDSTGWRAPNDPENPSPQELENLEYAKKAFRLLLDAGADPFTDAIFYDTPWQVAVDEECAPCLQIFTEASIKKAVYLVSSAH